MLCSNVMCKSDLEYMLIECRSLIGLRANARTISTEKFFKGGIKVGYGVRR